MNRATQIEKILTENLNIEHVSVEDFSESHKGHQGYSLGGGSHISVFVVSDDFAGLSRIQRHKKVHSILAKEFSQGLHALTIRAQTVSEHEKA